VLFRATARLTKRLLRDNTFFQNRQNIFRRRKSSCHDTIFPHDARPAAGISGSFSNKFKATRRWAPNPGGAMKIAAAGQAALAIGSSKGHASETARGFCVLHGIEPITRLWTHFGIAGL
jgi:hypothetical protein